MLPYGNEIIDLDTTEINEPYMEQVDNFLGTKVVMPGRDSVPVLAEIKNRKRNARGDLIVEPNSNPILDTRIYELEYHDGRIEEVSVNNTDGTQGCSWRSLMFALIPI